MDRYLIIGLLIATPVPAAAPSPTAVPEIAAQLPSGVYAGHALQADKKHDLSLNVHESKPGGQFVGTVHLQGNAGCESAFQMSGDIKPAGVVHIESRTGVGKECQRIFKLNLAGNELKGTMLTTEGTYQVLLKRFEQ